MREHGPRGEGDRTGGKNNEEKGRLPRRSSTEPST